MQKLAPIPIIYRAVSNSLPISVDWKGLEPDDAIGEPNEQYLDDFKGINGVAALAYIICCSEWLFYFLCHHFKPEEANNFEKFIIASWVWVCELPRKLPPYYDLTVVEVSQSRPENAVAVEFVISSIWEGTLSLADDETFFDAALATQICEYVLPHDCGFRQWREVMLKRLIDRFPSGEKDTGLVQVSRRFFDTDIDIDDIDHEADCSSLIGDGGFVGNPYLPLREPE